MNTTTYPLKHPLQIGATTVTRLSFRGHSTAADYLAFDQHGGVAQNIALIASLSGSDTSLIERLHGADYLACLKIANATLAQDDALLREGGSPAADAADAANAGAPSADTSPKK